MPLVFPLQTLVEIEVFRGFMGTDPSQPGTAQYLGISQRVARTRTDETAFAAIDPVTEWIDASGRVAQPGDVYERQSSPNLDGTLSVGAWKFVGTSRALRGVYGRAANIDWLPTIAPEGVMRTPLGTPLVADDGSLLTRPASGEQDLDPWTGAPLTDENGNPVLVP